MKTDLRVVKTMFYVSDVDSDVETPLKEQARLIEWADEHPAVYRLIRENKSEAYGRESIAYYGWARGPTPSAAALVHRLEVFFDDFENANPMWRERAKFALEHHDDPDFQSGHFQQHAVWTDGKEYARTVCPLDYTDATKETVIDRFMVWMDPAYAPVTRITINGADARVFGSVVGGTFVASPNDLLRSEASSGGFVASIGPSRMTLLVDEAHASASVQARGRTMRKEKKSYNLRRP